MRFVRVKADGHCMFRSVAQAFHVEMTGELLTQAQETDSAMELRRMVGEYVVAHPKYVKSEEFIMWMGSRNSSKQNFTTANYRAYIPTYLAWLHSGNDAWGEERELGVLAKMLKTEIHVYKPDLQLFKVFNPGHHAKISVLYTPELHYDALVPDETGLGVTIRPRTYEVIDPLAPNTPNEPKGLKKATPAARKKPAAAPKKKPAATAAKKKPMTAAEKRKATDAGVRVYSGKRPKYVT